MSLHPVVFFGPAVICEKFNVEDDRELRSCFTETCKNYKRPYLDGKFCNKCGKEFETRTFKEVVPYDTGILSHKTPGFNLQCAKWSEGSDEERKVDYFIFGKSGIHIDADYEEVDYEIQNTDTMLRNFENDFSSEIDVLRQIYKGKIKVGLVLLSSIR